jgi:hypothetical protein
MRSLLIRCYPAHWRARYGDEFEAILEERPLGPFDMTDILLGALDARLRSRGRGVDVTQGRGFTMSLRIGGIAAILGALLFALAGLLNSGILVAVDSAIPVILFVTGLATLVVALAGLSAFQGRAHPRTAWVAFGLAFAGTVAGMAAGIVLIVVTDPNVGDAVWLVFFVGFVTALAGYMLFAVVTYTTAVLSRGGALLIAAGTVVPLAQPIMAVGLALFAVGWFVLGVQAIRSDRPATAPRPA